MMRFAGLTWYVLLLATATSGSAPSSSVKLLFQNRGRLFAIQIIQLVAIQAIPFTLLEDQKPIVFDSRADLTIMTDPAPEGFDSDQFCQLFYGNWWIFYQALRSGVEKPRRPSRVPPELYHVAYTDYPDRAPVEAFAGESFVPLKSGWRTGLYGCLTGCQDIRLTFEWIIAMYFEQKHHVRARAKFGFQCEDGLVALTTDPLPSKREDESPSSVESSINLLQTMMKTKTDKLSLYGEPGMVNKCTCVRPTGTQRALAERLAKMGADSSGVNRRNYTPTEPRPVVTPKPRKGRPPELNIAESSQARKKKKRVRIDADHNQQLIAEVNEDIANTQTEQMTCYDYDYPMLPQLPIMAPLTNSEEPTPDRDPITELVRAQLIALDFDAWYSGMGQSSQGQGSSSKQGR